MSDLEAEDLDSLEHGDVDSTVKVLVIGNGHVGKSTYVQRFCRGTYNDTYKKTIGCEYSEKRKFQLKQINKTTTNDDMPARVVDIMIWDTAGQEEYRSLNHKYYGGAGCALLLFSTTDSNSFRELPLWKAKVLELCGNVPMAIVQTKYDAALTSSMVDDDEVEKLAASLQLRLYRSSSETGLNVEEPFNYVALRCLTEGGGGNSESQLAHISSLATTTSPAAASFETRGSGSGGGEEKEKTNEVRRNTTAVQDDNNEEDNEEEKKGGQEEEDIKNKKNVVVDPKLRVYHNRPTKPSRRRTNGKKEARCNIA